MRPIRQLLLLLLAAVLLVGSAAPASADAKTKRKPTACQAAKAKAKKSSSAARKKAVRRACRKPVRRPVRPVTPTPPVQDDEPVDETQPPTPVDTVVETVTISALEQGVMDCANRERAARGIGPLQIDASLTRAARGHAADMSQRSYFSHETPEGRTPWDRIEAALQGALPFRAMGENIAMGFSSAEATCRGWMASPGHKRNILDPIYTLIGPAWVDGYAVQNFGTR